MYTSKDIDESSGLDKQYKEFWNAKASELCQDKTVRHKLNDKSACNPRSHNTSWTLHKSDLLELEAEELAVYVSVMDDVHPSTLSFIESNKTKMMELTESLRLVYANATKEIGAEVSTLMKELRKAQSALKKS